MSDPLPGELRDFLARHIDSISHLEALLLLRSASDAAWDAHATAQRLYVGAQEASEVLAHLAAHGLLSGDASGYRFDPASPDLREMADLLAEHYKHHLIPITNLIHAKPRRIRQFADAFKLKKE
jgi:hypothetical protein